MHPFIYLDFTHRHAAEIISYTLLYDNFHYKHVFKEKASETMQTEYPVYRPVPLNNV